eukprot:7514957-Karenia_brevis.AAC.1
MDELTTTTWCSIMSAPTPERMLRTMLSSSLPIDWQAFGKLVAKVRQVRRKRKQFYESQVCELRKNSFKARADKWRSLG